jgi:hypothetical protein
MVGYSISGGRKGFFSSPNVKLALRPTRPLLWVLGIVSPVVRQPGRKADHLSVPSAPVKQA